jgi:tetratricopeptide (TPR) repeat protein
MVSFEVRRVLAIAARVACVAALALPTGLLAQLGRLTEQQREIVDTIDEKQSDDGSYSLELVEPLTALSLLYQERGDYQRAAETVERALHVVRANLGLYTMDQASLMRLLIASEQATGDFAEAGKLEERLLTLARRHPDDLRTVPILREAGDRQMAVAEQVLGGDYLPQLTINVGYAGGGSTQFGGSPTFMARALTMQALSNYGAAINVLLRHKLYASEELRELEMQLVEISLYGQYYQYGRNSLRRMVAYDAASFAPWLTRVKGVVHMADWDLLYSHNGMAVNLYEEIHEELTAKNVESQVIDEIFAPATPVVIPAFLPNPLVSPETDESTGFVDVAFEITKYGRGQAIEVLDTTNASKAAQDELVLLIKRSRFRPRLTDGAFVRTEPVTVRYYVSE